MKKDLDTFLHELVNCDNKAVSNWAQEYIDSYNMVDLLPNIPVDEILKEGWEEEVLKG